MARASVTKPYVSFIGGLWTESSPLSHPENTSKIEQNFKLNPDGSRERRLGLEFDGQISETLGEDHVVESYRWTDPGNINDTVVVAIQTGSKVTLYREKSSCASDYVEEFSFDLEDYRVNSRDIPSTPVDFASGNGKLFIAHGAIQPLYINYTVEGSCSDLVEGWSIETVQLYERDFDGVEDGLANNQNPTTLSDAHRYNLLNQGWTDEYIQKYFDEVGEYPSNNESWFLGLYIDPATGNEEWSVEELRKSSIGTANTPRGHFIRNVFDTCDIFEDLSENGVDSVDLRRCSTVLIKFQAPHGLVDSDGETVTVVGSSVVHTFPTATDPFTDTEVLSFDGTYTMGVDVAYVDEYTIGLIWDEVVMSPNFDSNESYCSLSAEPDVGVSALNPGVPISECCTEEARPEVNGVYAGRVWYSGISSDRLGNRVYFSQVLRTDDQIGRMYQEYDPTAEEFSELIKTDGGFVEIPEMGWVRAMKVLKDSLLIFADNGIWSITGGNYEYFSATSYSVSKLTEVGVVAKKSIEEIEDTWVYAANRGIYIISSENRVQNITEEAIHTRYRKIPRERKREIDIIYNPYDKTLHVLHGLEYEQERWRYCSELIINHRIKAWYDYRYKGNVLTHMFLTGNDSEDEYALCYLSDIKETNDSYYMSNCNFTDWALTNEATDAPAYMLTGPELLGDLSKDKQISDMCVFMETIPESGCIFRGRWDWACGECSGDFTTEQQVFKPKAPCDDMYPHQVARADIKVRGHGRAFEIEFSSEPDKPLKLYGWSVDYESRNRS